MSHRIRSIFRFLFRRKRLERELEAELRYHIDRLTEWNIAHGMAAEEARQRALQTVGSVESAKEQCRDARRGRLVEAFLQDVRHGARRLRQNPGFAAAAIVTLALGCGANTAIFSVVYGTLLRPLPYFQGGQLVALHQQAPNAHLLDVPFSVKEIEDYRTQSHTLAGVAEHHGMNFLLMDHSHSERVEAAVVSANFFDLLGVRPLLGRTFVAADEKPGAPAVLILTHKYWQTRTGGDPNIVGKIFEMNRRPHTVIGVLPPIPQFPSESDIYVPTSQCPTRSSAQVINTRTARMLTAVARLQPGVSLDQAQSDLAVLASQIQEAHPDAYPKRDGYGIAVTALQDDLTSRARTMFLVLLGVSGFVLLLACANVANLLLARLLKLERELAVRAALGASRGRLLRQILTESLVLSVCGGAAGLALAPAALAVLVKFAARFTTRAAEVSMDAPVLLFTAALSVATGILFGLAPALAASRWIGRGLQQAGNRGTAGRRSQRLRGALVVAQVALSVILLAGAGLMLRSFERLQQVNPGFQPDRLLTLRMSALFPPYTMESAKRFEERLQARIAAVPGVESVALASSFPFNPVTIVDGPGQNDYQIEGRPDSRTEAKAGVDIRFVSAGYFATIRQPILSGRAFTAADEHGPAVAIINQTLARHRFPNENPIGRRIRFDEGMSWTDWVTIVGVAGDVQEYGLQRKVSDEIYGVYRNGFLNRLIVRASQDAGQITPAIRSVIHDMDPMIAIDKVYTVERAEYESLASPRVMMLLLGIFAGLALSISCSGIASVMALAVSQRTHEIGIRMALGARRTAVVNMLLRHGLALALAGAGLGIVAAGALTRLLTSFLYGTSPTDLVTFAAAPLLFLAVAALASFLPARRATAIDPLDALRQD